MSFKLINPPTIHESSPTYSHVQITPITPTCNLITIAGQVGVDAKTHEVAPTYAKQIQLALENLGECLKSVGATPANIVNTTHYVVNLDPNDKSRAEAYISFMGGHRPPGTLVGVAALADPRLTYEVQAMAVVHTK